MFGAAAPDALAALVHMLATLRDNTGNTTISGLDSSQTWSAQPEPAERFRADAGVLDSESLLGAASVSDMIWARPAVTILGIDCPRVRTAANGAWLAAAADATFEEIINVCFPERRESDVAADLAAGETEDEQERFERYLVERYRQLGHRWAYREASRHDDA